MRQVNSAGAEINVPHSTKHVCSSTQSLKRTENIILWIFKNKNAYRSFILIRLAKGEPQVETQSPFLHQQGTSNALIDGSEKTCHLPGDRQKERQKIVPLLNATPHQYTHTRARSFKR